MGEIIPSDHLQKIDDAEEQLRGRDPRSADPVDLAFRINDRKIGSAEDLPHGMVKLSSFRTQHPGALLSGVFILHDEEDEPPRRHVQVIFFFFFFFFWFFFLFFFFFFF